MAQKASLAPSLLHLRYCLLAMVTLAFLMHWLALPKITDISKETVGGGSQQNMLLPANINIHNNNQRPQNYTFTINYQSAQQTVFHIQAENCIKRITLNGFPIVFPLGAACNFINGLNVDLSHQLVDGDNKLRIETKAPGLAIGPLIFSGTGELSEYLGSLLIGTFCLALIYGMQFLTGEVLTGLILAAGFVFYMAVLSHTTFMQRKYDMPQHLEYISFIANSLRWPNTFEGFLTYHPPLYYTLQAAVMRLMNLFGSFDVLETLRLCNVLYYLGAMVFSALAVRLIIKNPIAYYSTVVMMVAYPGGAISAPRIDSNLLFYTCFSGTLYFLLRWLQAGLHKDMAWALAICGIGIATRTNAMVLPPLFLLAALYQWRKEGFGWLWKHTRRKAVWVGLLVLLIGLAVNFGRPAYDNMYNHRDQSYIVANADYLAAIAGGLRITNEWASYFSFSLKDYLNPPYYNVWSPSGGRYYFWSSAMKSSLYGEFFYPHTWAAFYLNWCLLGFVFYIIASIIAEYPRLQRQPEWLMLFFALFIPLMGLAANRLLHPIACSQDFRYIQSAAAVFCAMVGLSIQHHISNNRMYFAGIGIGGITYFSGLSLWFVLNGF